MKRAYLAAAVSAALAFAGAAGTACATDLSWQGGTGNLMDPNYTDGTNPNLTPTSADTAAIGANGIASNASGDQTVGRLFVGHTLAANPGDGTVNITGGSVSTTLGKSGRANAGVIIGNGANGTLSISNASLTSNRLITVGLGDSATLNATLNVGPGATVTTTAGDILLGSGATSSHGIAGHLNQTGGTVTTSGNTIVGDLQADGSSFSISSGNYTTNTFTVGQDSGSANNVTAVISGDAVVTQNATKNFFMGLGSNATGVALTLQDNATLNVGNRFLMGGVNGTIDAAHDIVFNQTGGTLNAQLNVSVADQGGYATYNFSNGVINTSTATATGNVIGRQGIGRFFQTGGTANFVGGLSIGNDQGDTTLLPATGLYEISAGTLAPSATGTAVNIGQAGTGMLHVIGGDSTITVTGAFIDSSTASGNGTLSYTLQAGEPLTEINVTGDATFAAGSILAFDLGGVAPSQSSYDLLTATTITDSGLTFDNSAAPGWGFQIVSGGNGQVLQAITVPEPASLGLLAGAGLLALRRRRRA